MTPKSVEIKIRAQPRAGRTEIAGTHGDALKIRLAAPPVDGKANEELIAFLSATLGVPTSAVELIRGRTSRTKTVRIQGMGAAEARERLGL